MPVNNCKTLKDAKDATVYFEENSVPIAKVKVSDTGFKCFVPLEAKDISVLMGLNDPTNIAPKEVIFAPPATIVYWQDGSRTVVKCSEEDEFSEEMGFILCFMKKSFGNTGKFNDYINDALAGAKRYYPNEKSDNIWNRLYIKQIKDDVVRILNNALSKNEEVMIDEPGNSI